MVRPVASRAIAEAVIRNKALATAGVSFQPGWVIGVATSAKVFIDIFIGVWTCILAWLWSTKIQPTTGERISPLTIWHRFPKFILGYVMTFLIVVAIGAANPGLQGSIKSAMVQANVFRTLFFTLTLFSIGVMANFRQLWQEGIARLAAVYVTCLCGYIIWVGLLISWFVFHGVLPPTIKG